MMIAAFSSGLFLAASLMFALQPMTGKMLLPIVGGAPSGWIVAMAFFQTALLGGYLIAHLLSRFTPRLQALIYLVGMAAACFYLPISLPKDAVASGPMDIFVLLSKTVGIPFLFLSATSSTLQRLFSASPHKDAQDPYFLYAASNLGSLAGLFVYPLFMEPMAGLAGQSHIFLYAHLGIMVLTGLCLFIAQKPQDRLAPEPVTPVTNKQRGQWILLAFAPSSLLLGLTTHLTTDIVSAPMLWVVPLAIYIATFICAFARKDFFPVGGLQKLQLPAVMLSIGLIYFFNAEARMSMHAVMLHLVAFGITALLCHKLLAASRPAKDRLTEFYLMISIGGALGGLLNAFAIPIVLDRLIEYPLLLAASLALNPAFHQKPSIKSMLFAALGGLFLLMLLALVKDQGVILDHVQEKGLLIADILLLCAVIFPSMHPKPAITAGLAVIIFMEFIAPKDAILAERNFFGVVKLFNMPIVIGDKVYDARYMYHGTTTHGFQILDPELEKTPTSYFTRTGPVGNIFAAYNPKKILITGLGTGTINCFKTPDNEITFVEIDPNVVKIAKEEFTFLSACGEPEIIVGDGRLALTKMDEKFDLILIDAFSADTIPTHLITAEALKVYESRLTEDGVIVFNLSNRYMNLWRSLANTAASVGMYNRFFLDIALEEDYASHSQWMALSPSKERMNALIKAGWIHIPVDKNLRPWTDDYTNLLSTVEFGTL